MMTLPVTNIKVSIVKPLQKTAQVEALDATFTGCVRFDDFIPILFFYTLEDKSRIAYNCLLRKVKESLQKVLLNSLGGLAGG
jgi:hypothetical protein